MTMRTMRRRKSYPTCEGSEAMARLREDGLLWYLNWSSLHTVGLSMMCIEDAAGQIIPAIADHREFPNLRFSPEEMAEGYGKFERTMEQWGRATGERRQQILGYIKQPLRLIGA